MQYCKTKYLEKEVKQIVTKSATFADLLVPLERQYSSYETDLSIWTEIQNLAMLPSNPNAARIYELLADVDGFVGGLTPDLTAETSCFSGCWPISHETCGISVGLRWSARQEPSAKRTCLYFDWSWRWRRRGTSTPAATALQEATLNTMAVGIKDLDLLNGLPLRVLAT